MTVGAPLMGVLGNESLSGVSALYAESGDISLPVSPPVKSIIVLWMNGGPSQIDTFDPKPGHKNGGPVRAIKSAVPGISISGYLPQVASVMDRMALIRCMSTKEGNHARARDLMHTGFTPNPTVAYPGVGSIVAFEKGDARLDLPANVSINAPGHKSGILGMGYDPLLVNAVGSEPVRNLSAPARIDSGRIDRRLKMMQRQNGLFRKSMGGYSHESDDHDAVMKSAVRFMRSDQLDAFDYDDEPAAVREAYGDSQFGRGCLLARRLVESGVKFVEVSLNGWDTHQDNFTVTKRLCGELDPAMATLIKDLESRDLLQSTLIIWMGEFGRTPQINGNDGRDHFASAWSVALAGAGVRPGTVLGETSSDGMSVIGNSVTAADVFRTILWLSGINPDYEYFSTEGRPVRYADGGRLITGMIQS